MLRLDNATLLLLLDVPLFAGAHDFNGCWGRTSLQRVSISVERESTGAAHVLSVRGCGC